MSNVHFLRLAQPEAYEHPEDRADELDAMAESIRDLKNAIRGFQIQKRAMRHAVAKDFHAYTIGRLTESLQHAQWLYSVMSRKSED